MSNVNVIVDFWLLPGMVTAVVGVIVKFPLLSVVPTVDGQKGEPRVAPVKFIGVAGFPFVAAPPPLAAFHVTWTDETVTAVNGLVMTMLICLLPFDIEIGSAVMALQDTTGVEVDVGVAVGVFVGVAVGVLVAVGVEVGIPVGVLVGVGVKV